MPRVVRCENIAPLMTPIESTAPAHAVQGISKSMDAISSAIPLPILPSGSSPSVSKMYTPFAPLF